MAEPALIELVERAIASLAEEVQARCDRDAVLRKLASLGALRVDDVKTLVVGDIQMVTAALHPMPVLLAFNLRALALANSSAGSASVGSPFVGSPFVGSPFVGSPSAFETPAPTAPEPRGSSGTASNAVVVTVKVGAQTPLAAQMITVAPTTTFAALLGLAFAGESAAERAKLAALPVKVAAYTGPQHLTNQKMDSQLSALVVGSIALGYRHVVFSLAPPAQQPAARPSASAFESMMGAHVRPDRETGDDEDLPFDKALFNWLVDRCERDGLGVRGVEKEPCSKVLKAVRDALQAIDGREGQFQYTRVPERLKAYKIGDAVKRSKRPAKAQLASNIIRGYADRLLGAIDGHAFMRSTLWREFKEECQELHTVLMLKYKKMTGVASAEAERRAKPTVTSATIQPDTIEPCAAGTIARYESLERMLQSKECYEIVELTEEMIASLHPPSGKALENRDTLRKHYQLYRDNIRFHSIAVKKFPATFGSHRKLMLFLWKVPTDADTRTEADNDRTVQSVSRRLPEIHSRETRREFKERYSHAVVSKGVLASMYTLLTSDGSAPNTKEAADRDRRVMEFLVAGGDIELWPDLRALNSGEREKFNAFWAAAEAVLAALVTCAADDRHGANRTLLQPLSVPDIRRRVVERLASEGRADAAIPCDDWIAFQFQPRCPTRDIATRYTGRWEITLKVISTTLRKFNADAHYCNALELNVKDFLRDADAVLEREFRRLLEEREDEAELGLGRGFGGAPSADAHLSIADIQAHLDVAERIVRASNDDKCKVPTGEPGNPIGTNVRAMAAGVALKAVRLLAMDHSWHRASITPSVTLLTDLAHAFETNKWRNGQVVVSLKDSVLEPSSAFRNAAELATTILNAHPKPIIVDKRTDGGPEQNTTFGSVQLADVALWKKTGADLLIHQRPAADTSWVNDAEGVMPLLNLGMQHQSTERLKMDPKFEELLANEGSMSAIREKIASIEDASERELAFAAWLASLHSSGSPIDLLGQRFGRLEYTGRRVQMQPVATAEQIAAMHALVTAIDAEWAPEMTTKVALAKLEKLQRFLATHTIRNKYIVCVFKCGLPTCEFGCEPLRMPRTAFDELIGDRLKAKCQIIPHPEHTTASGSEHFDKYANLKGRPTSEKHMPSFKESAERNTNDKKADQATADAEQLKVGAKTADLWTAKRARCIISCSECNKPRVLYSLASLSPEERDLAQSAIDDVSSFVCGATELFAEGHMLASKLFVRSSNKCGVPVETQYFTSKLFRDCCTWCGTTDALELVDLQRLVLNGAKGYSICKKCHADGKKVVTFGKATKTGAKKAKAKGAKRRKAREDDHQYKVEIILAKREVIEVRKGKVMQWAVKWAGYDQTDEMTWEPAGNLLNVREEVDAFEQRLASMPKLDAFTAAAGASACCFGSLCKFSSDSEITTSPCFVCGDKLHHSCACNHPFLRPFYDKFESNNVCFDCALLVALMERKTPFAVAGAQLMFAPYYKQLRGVASLVPSPFGLGALLATKSLKLVEPEAFTARGLPALAKCATCKSAEGELRACSFCKSGIYHNTAECLGEVRVPKASLAHKAFPWCCPKCFKKGKVALEKTLLAPAHTAGQKRKR